MNCEQVQSLLLAYLDGEVTPSERALILAHLFGCTVCQQKLDLLSTARSQIRSVLQRRARQAVPSREAWIRLESRLMEAAQPSSGEKRSAWFSRKAPNASRASNQLLGGVRMKKRWIFSGLAGVIVLPVLALLVAQTATPVSARQILDRAYAVQSAQTAGEGIEHNRIETYHNICVRPEGGAPTIVTENYLDAQSGYFRTVTTEVETGNVLEVSAFDGVYIYEGQRFEEVKRDESEEGSGPQRNVCDFPRADTNDPLTIYRGAQSSVASENLPVRDEVQTHEDIFHEMRKDPNAELLGEETWMDGRTVYVLRSWQPVKAIVEGTTEMPMGWVVSCFDTETYKIVESRATTERDGQEVLVYSYRVLVDEVLPAGSNVAWNLDDLQGIPIVDDPDGQHMSFLPAVISEQELVSRTETAYLLQDIPEGFTLEISAGQKQPAEQPFIYLATYHNEAGDHFVIESISSEKVKLAAEGSSESYTTPGGLKITFLDNDKGPSEKQFTSVVVETPDGMAFIINSTLPRETVKAFAEELMLVK